MWFEAALEEEKHSGKYFWNIAGGRRLKTRREECRRNDHIDIEKTL